MKDKEYRQLHDELEQEYFENVPGGELIVDGGPPSPRFARALKEGKSRSEFDDKHAALSLLAEEHG